MKLELNKVNTMSKTLSTYERKMKDSKFKRVYQKHYHELLFSELMISIMEGDDKSVRKLAKEANLSPSVIQDLRSGKQHDIKVLNLIKILHVLGYEIMLKKGEERYILQEKLKDHKKHLTVIAA